MTRAVLLKWSKRVVGIIVSLFLIFSFLPYFIPVIDGQTQENIKPYPESKFIDIQGVKIHYRLWEPTGEQIRGKVLLVHGFGASTFSWRYTAEAMFSEGYLVMAVDLPAFGYSSRAVGLDHSQDARGALMWELIKEIDMRIADRTAAMKWNLIGHSMGGGTVSAMAIQTPEATKSVILVNGALKLSGRNSGWVFAYPPARRWMQVILQYYIIKPDRIQKLLQDIYGRLPTSEEVEGYYHTLTLPGTVEIFYDLIKTQTAVAVEELRETNIPVAAIWGEQDRVIPVSQAEDLLRQFPELKLHILKAAGHCPMETHYEEFNNVLLDIINLHNERNTSKDGF